MSKEKLTPQKLALMVAVTVLVFGLITAPIWQMLMDNTPTEIPPYYKCMDELKAAGYSYEAANNKCISEQIDRQWDEAMEQYKEDHKPKTWDDYRK